MNWLEVSMTVNGELAEAVADVLARFAPNGVTTEQAVDFVNDEDEGTPVGPITVRAYLPADEGLEETRQKLEEALFYLGMIQPLPAPVFTPLADQNWMEAWKERYKPIPIGKKLIIVPAWLDSPDAARLSIKIDPGMAFGTGTHPSTQLCLELIEKNFERLSSAEPPGINHDRCRLWFRDPVDRRAETRRSIGPGSGYRRGLGQGQPRKRGRQRDPA